MKFEPAKCPKCNEDADGTVDRLYAKALLSKLDDETFEYFGETEIWWDSAIVEKDGEGHWELICPKGHEWYAKMTETEKKPA